nr:MAG TPA: hypothetical protein [Caudoviricetes sp.]
MLTNGLLLILCVVTIVGMDSIEKIERRNSLNR